MKTKIVEKLIVLFGIFGFVFLSSAQQTDLKTFISKAQALENAGEFQKAVDILKEAVRIYPKESNVHLELGLAWGRLGEKSSKTGDMMTAMTAMNESFREFEKSTQLDSENFNAHFYFGVYGVNVPAFFGKLDQGVEHLEKALSIAKKQPKKPAPDQLASVYRFLAQGYKMQGRYDEARKALQEVINLLHESEIGNVARKELKNLVKPKERPIPHNRKDRVANPKILSLQKKLEKSPEDFGLLMELGKAYLDAKNWVKAQSVFRQAVYLDSTNLEAHLLLLEALRQDAMRGYDERIYKDQNVRTNLAFDVVRELEKCLELDPTNTNLKIGYALVCIQMPFFVQKIDRGLAILESMVKDKNLPDSVKTRILYNLGYGYRKKGNAFWMKLVKNYPHSKEVQLVYDEFGLRNYGEKVSQIKGEKVVVTFHLGFQDELEPQTAVWVEDSHGKFVKTLYVSGFSGFVKEKQVNLPIWANSSQFETDGTTGASIDWGKHTYVWDLTDRQGKRVKDGVYKVIVEASWWPSMQYGRISAEIHIGKSPDEVTVEKKLLIPLLHVQYIR